MRKPTVNRRQILAPFAAAIIVPQWFEGQGAFAQELLKPTPRLTEGPFYPDKLPLDRDNDLILIGDSTTPAVGQITHLTGRVLSTTGVPIRGASVEIWQCDANAVYLHSRDSTYRKAQQDANFQGYGHFETATDGGYRFRTIKPVPYPGRPAPHIHIKISRGGHPLLTTQLMVRGHQGNRRDRVFRNAMGKSDLDLVMGDFKPLPESKLGELACNFDIVLGRTPDDRQLR